jgi:hypothetical protein
MSKSTKTLHANQRARNNLKFSDGIENRDAGAQDGGVFNGINVSGDGHHGFGVQEDVFCVSAITGNPIDGFFLAHLELTSLTLGTDPIVTSVPWPTNPIPILPSLLAVTDGDDIANDFVAWDDGEGVSETTALDDGV